ncbi:MAG: plastocyanin/azurin family copper-binding protein [Candidatus Omnitrophota bacterium]
MNYKKLIILAFLLGGLILFFVSCRATFETYPLKSGGPKKVAISITDSGYDPAAFDITLGTTVTWTNNGTKAHTVTSGTPGYPSGLFDSGDIAPGFSYSYTFNTRGIFYYYCKHHPNIMTGTLYCEPISKPQPGPSSSSDSQK